MYSAPLLDRRIEYSATLYDAFENTIPERPKHRGRVFMHERQMPFYNMGKSSFFTLHSAQVLQNFR